MSGKKRGEGSLVIISFLTIFLALVGFVYSVNESVNGSQNNISLDDNPELNQIIENITSNSTLENNITSDIDLNISVNDNITEKATDPDITEINDTVLDNITTVEETNVSIKDSKGQKIGHQIKILKIKGKDVLELIPNDGPVKKILFNGFNLSQNTELGIDDAPENLPSPGKAWEEVYAIDPSQVGFVNATVTVTAKGNELYKCKEWDFTNQQCNGEWIFQKKIIPGQDYTFTLTKDDPGFGEILATAAAHLDINYTIVGDIFDKIKTKDDDWSEPVYQGEYVRVTFESNLTDGRIIDVYVRSNDTYAYFDVYEAGTQHKVGTSGITAFPELQYMIVKNLTKPTDTFDFKVVKVPYNPIDATSDIDPNVISFLEFDYIHDDIINSTQADGLLAYEEGTVTTPRYRTWDETDAFTAELTNTQDVGGDVQWVVVEGSHERDEMIMGTIDLNNDVNIQIFNSTDGWESLIEIADAIPNSAFRGFDIAYEQVSGDALIVYENLTAADDSSIFFRFWNGTGYTAQQTLATSMFGADVNWITLVPRSNADDIMLLVHNNIADLAAIPWNGTAFDSLRAFNLTLAADTSASEHFAFEWEANTSEGFVSYSTGGAQVFRTYDPAAAAGSNWGTETTLLDLGGGNTGRFVRLCADPVSDHIGVIFQDTGNDVNVRMWDGTAILATPPGQDGGTEAAGANNGNADCAWSNDGVYALFGFIDANALAMDHFNFTKPNSWTPTVLTTTATTATFGSDDIAGMRFAMHPTSNEVMVIAQDIAEDVSGIRWNGGAFATIAASPFEAGSGILNGGQEGAMFDWYRFDTIPEVNMTQPAVGSSFNIGDTVIIRSNATDNIAVSAVFANVTSPSGGVTQRPMGLLGAFIYNATFTGTTAGGTYTIRIIANDTSTHKNFNQSVTRTFTVADNIIPAVFAKIPANNSAFSTGQSIEVGANVTDDANVSQVHANVTKPDSTIAILNFSRVGSSDKFNVSYTVPDQTGFYTVRYIANDTSDNRNTTEITNFTVTEGTPPAVFDVRPFNESVFNATNKILISANVTDNVAVAAVIANITRPGGTISEISLVRDGDSDKYNNTFTVPNVTGRYNVSFIANDTSNNRNATVFTNFTVNDVISPVVFDVRPLAESVFNTTNKILISANVTDAFGLNVVFANITRPGGTLTQLQLIQDGASDKFNNTFTIPNVTGRYNVSFIANDTNNNYNLTVFTNFTVNDITNPAVFDVRPLNASVFNVSLRIVISANVTDGVGVDTVFANISFPNTTLQQLTLIKDGASDKYNNTFLIPNVTGIYTVRYIANDTSGNVNSTETTEFRGNDTLKPDVFDVRPVNASVFDVSDRIEVAANVTDNTGVDVVLANISFPNSTLQQLTLNRVGSTDKYNNSFLIPNVSGIYTVRFVANDTDATDNNVNSTVIITFRGNDSVNPEVFDAFPRNNSVFNVSNVITISANATDGAGVDVVLANISFPNSTLQQLTLVRDGASDKYNNTFTVPGVVGFYTVRFAVNDTSNNLNSTTITNFTVNDIDELAVFDVRPPNASVFDVGLRIEIAANATDDVGVDVVLANISFPNSTLQQLTLNRVGSTDKYNNSFLIPNVSGIYTVRFVANDTSNNLNLTTIITFRGNDSFKPDVFDVRPANGTTEIAATTIQIAANVTDGVGVDIVTANVSEPGGTATFITLIRDGTSDKYNNTYSVPAVLGFYNVSYFANDTSNNTNSTVKTQFRAVENVKPEVIDLRPINASSFNVNTAVTIAANVTDNIAVDVVIVNMTFPNSSIQQLTLVKNGSTDIFNISFTIPNLAGLYNVRFVANDTSNNINSTEVTIFRGVDVTAPEVTIIHPQNQTFNNNETVAITLNITDASPIDVIKANVTLPNGSIILVTDFGIGLQNDNFDVDTAGTRWRNGSDGLATEQTCLVDIDGSEPGKGHLSIIGTGSSGISRCGLSSLQALVDDYDLNVTVNLTSLGDDARFIMRTDDSSDLQTAGSSTVIVFGRIGGQLLYRFSTFGDFGSNVTQINAVDTIAKFRIKRTNSTGLPLIQFFYQNATSTSWIAAVNKTHNESFQHQFVHMYGFSSSAAFGSINITVDDFFISGDNFSFALFNQTGLNGTYNISVFVNDTAGFTNDTETTKFNIVPSNTPPGSPTIFTPASDEVVSGLFNITWRNTSDTQDDLVHFNISLLNTDLTFNATIVSDFGNIDTVRFEWNTSLHEDGVYNMEILVFENETVERLSNSDNVDTNFTIDNTAPAVFDLKPVNASVFNVSVAIEISANVTDRFALDVITANISFPNSTLQQLTLVQDGTSDKFNNTFLIPNVTGIYTVRIIANDSTGNFNITETTEFRGNDSFNPDVFDVRPLNASVFDLSTLITVSANVTDGVGVGIVLANISFPNSTLQQLTLVKDGTSDKYNNTFLVPNLTGIYTVRYVVNDTSGNLNSTVITTFRGNDSVNPAVVDAFPRNNSVFNVSNVITISANATDGVGVGIVLANISFPNSTLQQLILVKDGASDKYNNTFTVPGVIGFYTIRFVVNDTSNNLNSTTITNFTVNDIDELAVFDVRPIADSTFDTGNVVTVSANVTDDVVVDVVSANITRPGGTITELTLIRAGSSDKYNNTFTVPNITGLYNITFLANDTSNNRNITTKTNFTVSDITPPNVFDVRPVNASVFNITETITISTNATDNINVSIVFANISFPNSTLQQLTLLRDNTSDKYNNTFTVPNLTGTYTIRYIANDTNNNINSTITTTFIANDSFNPLVFDLLPALNSNFNVSDAIEIAANVTDDTNVDIVIANVTLANGTVNVVTLSRVGSSDKFNNSFTIPDVLGLYNVIIIANDTSNNINATKRTNFTVEDTVKPVVFDVRPVNASVFDIADQVEIAANVTDNAAVDVVIANITFPNATLQQLTLSRVGSTDKYNNSFTVPSVKGIYTVRFIANDSHANANNTVTTEFRANDTAAPVITPLVCNNVNLNQNSKCNATVTDNLGIDTVTANVVLPNGTVQVQTVTNVSATFEFTFTNTVLVGQYNVTWRANDTSNNIGTATDIFNVSDVTPPGVVLNAPRNGFNTSSTTVTFNFTATDNFFQTVNCSVIFDSTVQATNATSNNGSETLLSVSSISLGSHTWNASCIDGSSNKNISENRIFTVDTEGPIFISLNTNPSSTDDLDPLINVSVTANVTDNITGVHTVILQRQLINETKVVNITMIRNTTLTNLYHAVFNASAGTHNLSLRSNDTANNFATSNVINITVQFERTWERIPAAFTTIQTNLNENVTLGTLTVNNTGDFILNFSISSDSNRTILNDSANFSLAPNVVRKILVNDTATSAGVKAITLNISATPNAVPPSRTTTANVVVAPGQPILVAEFITPSTETLTVTQGDTNVEFHANITNKGEGNATNVTFFFNIPSDWTVTFGTINGTFSEILSGDSEEKIIRVTIGTSASTGLKKAIANATGSNSTGGDLEAAGLIFADTVDVTVNAKSVLGAAGGGGGAPAAAVAVSGGGGSVSAAPGQDAIFTRETLALVRGADEAIPIVIKNIYENAVMENIDFTVIGFFSQYITLNEIIDPNREVFVETQNVVFAAAGESASVTLPGLTDNRIVLNSIGISRISFTLFSDPMNIALDVGESKKFDLDGDGKNDVGFTLNSIVNGIVDLKVHKIGPPDPEKLYFLEERIYEMSIFAPAYLDRTDFNLTLRIDADLVAVNPVLAGFTSKPLVEFRTLVFKVLAIGLEEVEMSFEDAEIDVQLMKDAGFPISKVNKLLEDAKAALEEGELGVAVQLTEEISKMKDDAFEANGLIKEIKEGIENANKNGLDVPTTERALAVTRAAFEREDFKTAVERAKETQLTLILETKGRINLLAFLIQYWYAVILGIAVIGLLGFVGYRELDIFFIRLKLKNIIKEELAIRSLIEETQVRRFKEGKLSAGGYQRLINSYEKRLTKIKQLRIELRNKQVVIINVKRGLENLAKEKKEIQTLMKQAQVDYLEKGKMTRGKFLAMNKSHKERLAQIEEDREALLNKRKK